MSILGSPFASSNSVQRLPAYKVHDKVTIRLDKVGSDTNKIVINLGPEDVTASKAPYFLMDGEVLTLKACEVDNGAAISILALSGTANVYWSIT